MTYGKEISNFLGVEESEIKSKLPPKTIEQMDLAWVRERFDILHNLAYPLFQTPKMTLDLYPNEDTPLTPSGFTWSMHDVEEKWTTTTSSILSFTFTKKEIFWLYNKLAKDDYFNPMINSLLKKLRKMHDEM